MTIAGHVSELSVVASGIIRPSITCFRKPTSAWPATDRGPDAWRPRLPPGSARRSLPSRLRRSPRGNRPLCGQIPSVIEGGRCTGRVSEPANPAERHELIDPALQRQAERGPAEDGVVFEDRAVAEDLDAARIGIPARPLRRFDDMSPDPFAWCVDQKLVMREQVCVVGWSKSWRNGRRSGSRSMRITPPVICRPQRCEPFLTLCLLASRREANR
jgi:hypothetical protein